jgi:hypothetical protein
MILAHTPARRGPLRNAMKHHPGGDARNLHDVCVKTADGTTLVCSGAAYVFLYGEGDNPFALEVYRLRIIQPVIDYGLGAPHTKVKNKFLPMLIIQGRNVNIPTHVPV